MPEPPAWHGQPQPYQSPWPPDPDWPAGEPFTGHATLTPAAPARLLAPDPPARFRLWPRALAFLLLAGAITLTASQLQLVGRPAPPPHHARHHHAAPEHARRPPRALMRRVKG